jgi:hypothetical protein
MTRALALLAAGRAAVGAMGGGSPAFGAVVGAAAGTAAGALWEDTASAGPVVSHEDPLKL